MTTTTRTDAEILAEAVAANPEASAALARLVARRDALVGGLEELVAVRGVAGGLAPHLKRKANELLLAVEND